MGGNFSVKVKIATHFYLCYRFSFKKFYITRTFGYFQLGDITKGEIGFHLEENN